MVELLNVSLRLVPENSRMNFYFPFFVCQGTKCFRVRYSYSPKHLADDALANQMIEEGFRRYIQPEEWEAHREMRQKAKPLVNLVTLSMDSPSGYAGAAHRHSPDQQLTIGGEGTTPGFMPVPVESGLWRACISAHAVVTQECKVHLIIEEVE